MSTAVDYTLKLGTDKKPEAVSVIMYDKDGVPDSFVLHKSHPTFTPLIRALKRKAWTKVPKLVSLAASVADQTEGNVQVKKDGIYYKGVRIDNSLTKRIEEIIKQNQPVKAMLRFMDNLFQNPQPYAINELYDWLDRCKMPITDDGHFMAYKRVGSDYKDCYTHTIDNSVGQIVMMKREDVDPDRRNECSRGLHFCSTSYLPSYPGDKIMQVKINPKDVVAIPKDYNYSKGRTWMYEVIKEIPADQLSGLMAGDDIDDYKTAVYSIAKERRKLLRDTLELPAVKRLIRRKKYTKANIGKMPYGRLANFYKRFYTPEPQFIEAKKGTTNRLQAIREAYGYTRGQVAEQMGVTYKQVYNAETAVIVQQETMDKFLNAILALMDITNTKRSGVSYPKPTENRKAKAAAANAPAMTFTPGASPDTMRVQSPDGTLALADSSYDHLYEEDEYGYEVSDEGEAPTTGNQSLDQAFEDALMAMPLSDLRDIEREAENNFRRNSKTLADMQTNEAEWRFIERVYLKRLGKK